MGTFYTSVYEAIQRIPRGCVASYGDVARAVGEPRKARYVGYAIRVNPRPGQGEGDIPCHRVVFADGQLSEAFVFGGADAQRALLQDEGVVFLDDMHVDMDACRWQPSAELPSRPTDIDWAAEMGEF